MFECWFQSFTAAWLGALCNRARLGCGTPPNPKNARFVAATAVLAEVLKLRNGFWRLFSPRDLLSP